MFSSQLTIEVQKCASLLDLASGTSTPSRMLFKKLSKTCWFTFHDLLGFSVDEEIAPQSFLQNCFAESQLGRIDFRKIILKHPKEYLKKQFQHM